MVCFFCLTESKAQNNANFWDIIQRGDQFYDSLAQIDPYLPDSFKVKHYTRKKFIWAHRVDESGDMNLTLEQMKEASEHKRSLMNGGGGQGGPLYSTINSNWQEMGPTNNPLKGSADADTWNRGRGVGRMWFIEKHPYFQDLYYSGSPTGGLWRSHDGGITWEVVNTDFLPVVGVSHVQFDPNNSNRLFIVTGDGDNGFTVSDGIYYSVNEGASWYNINGTTLGEKFHTHNLDYSFCENFVVSRKMVFIPEDNTLVVATNKRLYKSSAIASSATPQQIQNSITWAEKLSDEFADVIRVPGTNTLIAGGKKLYISYNLGNSWDLFPGYNNSDLPAFEGRLRHRMALRVSPDDNTKLYLAYTAYDEGQCFGELENKAFRYYRINLSTSQWVEWFPPSVDKGIYDGGRYQAFEVNVEDSDHIFIGNVRDPRQSLNGGTSFITLNKSFHDDMHWFKTFECSNCGTNSPPHLWVGTDGGLSMSTDYGATWEYRDTGLGVANIHGLSVLQRNFDNYFFGHFDHANVLFDGVNHHFIGRLGDSFETQMVPIGEEVYLFSAHNTLYQREKVELEFGHVTFLPPNSSSVSSGVWWGDIESNWKVPETLFYKFSNGVSRTTNLGVSFHSIFSNQGQYKAWELFSNPLHPNHLYVLFLHNVETGGEHHLYRTSNALDQYPSWEHLNPAPNNIPTKLFSDLAIDDENPMNFWLTLGTFKGFENNVPVERVWYFDNNASSLTAISDASLVYTSVGAIVHEYGSPNRVYIGTTSGVFYKDDNTTEWVKMQGIPEVEIHDMEINYCTGKLVIGTFGRGVWQVDLIDDNNGVMEIATNTTWNTSRVVRHDLVVKAGRTLKIEGSNPNDPIEIRFATGKKLIVEPGATLEVEHTTLTNHCGDMWQGVEVWGNKNESQKPEHQGFVWLKDGAIIEHAAIGIATIKHTGNAVPNHVDWGKTGGIIKATNATFRNNTKDVEFLAYKNMNIFGIEKANVSFFKNCTFETNDQALYASNWNSKKAHVTMYRVHGVRYEGCTFQNLTTDNEYLASGIASFEASYTVDKYCLTNPCALYEESRFINLRRGIESYSVMNPSFPIRVQKAIFENNFGGIYLNTIPLASVLENEFLIPRIYVPNSLTQTAYGLYLDSCMYYRVEENYFEAEYNSPLPYNSSVGIICYRTAKNDEEIYHNTFVNLLVGIEAIGSNRNSDPIFGLEFRCNDFTNTRHDLYVANWNNSTNPGIRKDQGSAAPGQSSDLAGNLFSHLNNEAEVELEDFFHDVPPIINYNHHDASSNSRVVPGGDNGPLNYLDKTANVINITYPNINFDSIKSCPSNLLDSVSSPGTDEPLVQFDYRQAILMADAEFHIALYESILDQLLDGGNTPLVNSEVDQVTLLTAWQLYAELLSMSPYVSEEIIQQLIAKEYDFPEALLRDILVLNVHTLSNNEIWHELDDRFNPLPEYMMNQVMAAAESGNTGADILRSYISHYNRQYYMALRRRLTNRLTDTTEVYGLDSAISLVANESSMYGIMMYGYLAHAADDHDLISDYQSKVTGYSPDDPWGVVMSNYFIWAEEYAASDSAFTLLGVNDWDQMAQQDEYSSPMANKALMYARMWGSEAYEEPILIPQAETYKQTPRKVQKASVLELKPNPAKDYVTVYYRTDKIKDQKVLRLMDLNGKVLQIIPLKYSEDQVVFSLREYAVGTYIISLYANGNALASEKLIIQK